MSDTSENLREFLLAGELVDARCGGRCYHQYVPRSKRVPFVWIMRRRVEFAEIMGEAPSRPWREYFDLEAVGNTPGQALDLADACRERLMGHSGIMGDDVVAYVDVFDHYDDYVSRNDDAGEYVSIAALNVEVTNP